MNFIHYSSTWAKSEVIQGRIMILIGLLAIVAFIGILRSEHELLRGSLIPLGILIFMMIGYGGFIIYSRPAHSKQAIALYQENQAEALQKEKAKHIADNNIGGPALKIYPILALLALATIYLNFGVRYQGMALGFAVLFVAMYIMDYGFVSRSEGFLKFLEGLS